MTEQELKTSIIRQGCYMVDSGLVAGTWGNISVRIPDGQGVLITPSGRPYHKLVPEDIVRVDLEGNVLQGVRKPSSETPLHLAVYRQRPDIQAIVHTHSVFASACAVARKSIPPVIEDLAQMVGGSVDAAEYALPGTEELAQNAVNALAQKYAVLLANHGVMGCGAALADAVMVCELVEKAAQIYLYAELLGGARQLSSQDVASMHSFYLAHYRQRQGGE